MARKTMWTGIAVLLAFAQGAAAQTTPDTFYSLSVTNKQTYASELFGAGSADLTVDYGSASSSIPALTLTLTLTQAQMRAIRVGHTADVTISLANAKFARNVPIGNFSAAVRNTTPDDMTTDAVDESLQANLEVTATQKRDDGARGDSSVTVRIAAGIGTGGDWAAAVAGTVNLTFELTPLTGLNKRAVTASVSVDSPTASGLVRSNAPNVGALADSGSKITGGVITIVDDAATMTVVEGALVDFAGALTFAAGGGGAQRINLAGGRTSLAGSGGQGYVASVTAGVPTAGPLQLDGDAYSIDRREDGAGQVNVTVTGDFRDGDMVFLDMDRDRAPDNGEALTLGTDGSMTGDFPLVDVAGNPAAPATDETQREEGVGTVNLIYRPNGMDKLRPAEFRTVFALDYDLDTSNTETLPHRTYTTTYSGVESTQKAYAIPPMLSADVGNVRVKCEVATECTVYLECDDQAGDSWFASAGEVEGRATMVMQSAAIAEMLGIGEDGWAGRLSCTVYSSRTISVQVLMRSGDVLVNNTYIDQDQ